MDSILAFLDKLIAIEGNVLVVKPRVQSTIGEAVKILNAAMAADLGPTEKAVLSRLATVAKNLQTIVG